LDGCTMERTPLHSPDGTKIVYWRNYNCSPTSNGIYIMNADGSGPHSQLSLSNGFTTAAGIIDWQPCPRFCPPARNYDVPDTADLVQVSLVPDFRQTVSSTQCSA